MASPRPSWLGGYICRMRAEATASTPAAPTACAARTMRRNGRLFAKKQSSVRDREDCLAALVRAFESDPFAEAGEWEHQHDQRDLIDRDDGDHRRPFHPQIMRNRRQCHIGNTSVDDDQSAAAGHCGDRDYASLTWQAQIARSFSITSERVRYVRHPVAMRSSVAPGERFRPCMDIRTSSVRSTVSHSQFRRTGGQGSITAVSLPRSIGRCWMPPAPT